MVRSGMRIAAAVAVVVVVSGCGSGESSAPKSPLTFDSRRWHRRRWVTTSAFPGPSPSSVSPQPSETFSPEQQEAADRVMEYFRILDEVSTNPDASIQPLADITTGQTGRYSIRGKLVSIAAKAGCRQESLRCISKELRKQLR